MDSNPLPRADVRRVHHEGQARPRDPTSASQGSAGRVRATIRRARRARLRRRGPPGAPHRRHRHGGRQQREERSSSRTTSSRSTSRASTSSSSTTTTSSPHRSEKKIPARRGRPPHRRRWGATSPYHSATSARETLRLVNRHFQLRTCTDHVLENRIRPCILYR